MKTFKRNAVIITVVLFVCVAAYLNWAYNNQTDEIGPVADVTVGPQQTVTPPPTVSPGEDGSGLFYEPDAEKAISPENSNFFALTRLNRQQARDASVETLAMVSQTEGASRETIDEALEKITVIASNSQKEAEIESLIMAKGFNDCVVFMSDDGVKVTVPAPMEGLSQTAVARITDIITVETAYKAADLYIIEVK